MAVESTLIQSESKKKPSKLRSIRFPRLSCLKTSSKSKFSCLSTNPISDNSSPEERSPVKMPNLSPNYMKVTTSYDAKKGNSQRGIGSVDLISTELSAQKDDGKIKKRPVMKKIMKNRSFRRSFKSYSQDSLPSSGSSFDSSDQSRSPRKSLPILSRTSSMRSVKIMVNKTSYKSKRGFSKFYQIPDKSTCSSTLKDSKFPEHVELQSESDRISKFKVCSYHHCSLHGGHYDDSSPPVKRIYRRRRLLKSQKSIRTKSEDAVLEMIQLSPDLDPLVDEESTKEDAGFSKVSKAFEYADLAEIAFGETSFPEQSYKETLDIMRKYSAQEQGLFTASKCCNCMARERKDNRNLSLLLKQEGSVFASDKDENNNGDLSNGAFSIRTKSLLNDFDEAKSDSENSSVLKLGVVQENDGKAESKNFSPLGVAEPNATVQKLHKQSLPRKKHTSMWNLISRHMIPDASDESENKLPGGANQENQQDCINNSPSAESSDFSEREMIPANEDAENQETELRKLLTIKLVREAIERILLPEVQDQFSDDQSVTSDACADEEVFTKENFKEPDRKNEEVDAASKSKNLNTEDFSSSEKWTMRNEVKNKSKKGAPKHWSNLKKWIILQRFIKALEKVRRINPRKPRYLELSPDPEAEKVSLRAQTADERKRAEEWMLDHALQQAISQLAPTQQRKVELLIKAFETVVPPQGDTSQVAFSKIRASSEENFQITSRKNEFVSRAGITSALNGDVLVEEKAPKENQEDECSTLESELQIDAVDGAYETDIKAPSVSECEATENASISSDDKVQEAEGAELQEKVATIEKEKECEKEPRVLRGFSLLLSRSDPNEDDTSAGKADKRKYISMWHMISQHVLSDVASKVGDQLLDGTDDGVEESNTPGAMKTCNSLQDFSDTKGDADRSREDRNPTHQGRSFCRDDAVKLIREAVNEILTTPIQDDSSDTQSVTSDIIMDQELLETEGGAKNSINSTEGGEMMSLETKDPEANTIITEKERALPLAKNPIQPQNSKNWSKLKKLILLKRSIKALERARKFNPRAPQLLPVAPDEEPEKVDLRHQMTDERKKAEKWMLDYAMQHIVTKLTPARKKRVAMLVEAFEAVVPLPEV